MLMRFVLVSLLALVMAIQARAAQVDAPTAPALSDDSVGQEIRQRITQLDSDTFQARDEAMQAIASHGAKAVPFLVESLDNPSTELRMRVMRLLAEHGSFENVAPYLLKAIDRPGGIFARTVLQERCVQQIDDSGEVANCERLFKFWGTSREKYRHESLTAFQNAKTMAQIALVVEPLLHIRDKVKQFDDLVARLTKLSVTSDQRHSPGYIVAETLAQGLRTGRADWVAFGVKYVEALEMLAIELADQKQTPNAIRQEISNRASWSQGATKFLVQLLDPESQPSKALAQSIPIASQPLHDSFFDGLRSSDSAIYSSGVGRVHIVDLLNDAIRSWPTIPDQGTLADLVKAIVETAHQGNKPKALVYLEALDACRKLPSRGLELNLPPAKQLADRLVAGARRAQNHRDFFPTLSVHSKLLGLLDRGIGFEHEAFPREFYDQFVGGAPESITEEQRMLLDKYVSIVDRLTKTGITFEQGNGLRVIHVLRKHLANGSDQITSVSQRLAELPTTAAISADRLLEFVATELDME